MDLLPVTPPLSVARGRHPLEVTLPLCVRSLEGAAPHLAPSSSPFDRAAVWLAHANADLSDWCRAGIRREFRSAARLADAISNLTEEHTLLVDLHSRAEGPSASAAGIAASRIQLELAALRQTAHTLATTPGFLSVFIRDDWSASDDWFRAATADATFHAAHIARMAGASLHAGADGLLAFHAALRVWAAAAEIAAEAALPFNGPGRELLTAAAAAAVVARLERTLASLSGGSADLDSLRARLNNVGLHRTDRVRRVWLTESAHSPRRSQEVLE